MFQRRHGRRPFAFYVGLVVVLSAPVLASGPETVDKRVRGEGSASAEMYTGMSISMNGQDSRVTKVKKEAIEEAKSDAIHQCEIIKHGVAGRFVGSGTANCSILPTSGQLADIECNASIEVHCEIAKPEKSVSDRKDSAKIEEPAQVRPAPSECKWNIDTMKQECSGAGAIK